MTKNPTTAESFQGLRADYQAAKTSQYRRRRTGLITFGSTADWHYRVEAQFLHLMEVCRDMDRNDTIIGQAVDRACQNTLQEGLLPDPNTGDKGLNRQLHDDWERWSKDEDECDIQGEMTFHDMEYLALRGVFVDGDNLFLPRQEGCLQMFEGHRLRTPTNTKKNVVHGVLLDENRKRQEYWFTRDDIPPYQALNLVSDTTAVPVRDKDGFRQVFHVRNPKRCTQTRGVSALVPGIDQAGMYEDITFAQLVKAQVAACFTIIRNKELGFQGPEGAPTSEITTQPIGDGTGQIRTLRGIGPGMEVEGRPGEKLEGFSPNVPNAEFFAHAKLTLTMIGINLGLPLVLLLLDASETNFSGFRGAVDQARLGFRHNQRWLLNRLHKPTWNWRVRYQMASDPAMRAMAARNDIQIFRCRWKRPAWPYLEPLKDASADLLRDRNCLISKRRLHAERGNQWPELAHEIVEDNALLIVKAKRMAQKINAKFDDGNPVHWREVASLPTPDGLNITLAGTEDQPTAADKPAAKPTKKAA